MKGYITKEQLSDSLKNELDKLDHVVIFTSDKISDINNDIKKVSLAGGGVVQLPNTVIPINPSVEQLRLENNVKLIGCSETIIKLIDNANYFDKMIGFTADNVIIENIKFDSNQENNRQLTQLDDSKRCSIIEGVGNNITIRNCNINYGGVYGISINAEWANKKRCEIINNTLNFIPFTEYEFDNTGIYIDTPNHLIQGNELTSHPYNNIMFGVGGIETHTYNGNCINNIINNYKIGIHITPITSNHIFENNNLNVQNNNIYDAICGIQLWNYTNQSLKNVNIQNNNITLNHSIYENHAEHRVRGIEFTDYCKSLYENVKIINNTIEFEEDYSFINDETYSNRESYIESYGIGGDLSNSSIKNLIINNNIISRAMKQSIAFKSQGDSSIYDLFITNNILKNTCNHASVRRIYRVPLLCVGNVHNIEYTNNTIIETRNMDNQLTFSECYFNSNGSVSPSNYTVNNQINSKYIGRFNNAIWHLSDNNNIKKENKIHYLNEYPTNGCFNQGDLIVLNTPYESKTIFKVDRGGSLGEFSVTCNIKTDVAEIQCLSFDDFLKFDNTNIFYEGSKYINGYVFGYDTRARRVYLQGSNGNYNGSGTIIYYPPIITPVV